MPNLPTLAKIDIESVPKEHRAWMTPIVDIVNRFVLEQTQLNQSLPRPVIKSLKVDPRSSFPIVIPWNLSPKPSDVHVAHVASDDPSAPIGSTSVQWEMTSGGVVITEVSGLTSGFTYSIDLSLTP